MRTIDLFCGAGGSSLGAQAAGAEVVAGFDAWEAASIAYKANFPAATVHQAFLEDLDPRALRRTLGPIDLLLASPECKSHSPARGAAKKCDLSRNTAFQVVRFARAFEPRWIVVENVVSMRTWSRFPAFKRDLERLGYHLREQVLNSADFGVPQRRRRLFIVGDLEGEHAGVLPIGRRRIPASKVVDLNGTYDVSPLRIQRRATATLERADRAISVLGDDQPFLLVYYGSDACGGWQRLSEPLRTITTLDRFALVKPNRGSHVMRMLQVPELKKAMGMPARFRVGDGTRREMIQLIGNAVCPPVMTAIVSSLGTAATGERAALERS